MPLIAFAIGFLVPWIFRLDQPQRTAIAMEVSLQNVSLAITIVTVAFPNANVAAFYSQYIILYGTFQIVFGVGISVLHQAYFRYHEGTTPCHYYNRWKQDKETANNPHMHVATINGSTIQEHPENTPQPPQGLVDGIKNAAYKGSSLDLPQLESDANGSGFVSGGQISSTTELIRMDSVDSQCELVNGQADLSLQRVDSCESGEGTITFSASENAANYNRL
jgi:hypothetical protein